MVAQFDRTLLELLAEHDIRLRSYQPGHSESVRCPKCAGGTKAEKSLSVTIDADGMGATWKCWRPKCGGDVRGGVRVRSRQAQPEPTPKSTAWRPTHDPLNQPDWFFRFWDERRIGAKTLEHFHIHADRWYFHDAGQQDAIVFPYRWRGKWTGRKFRAHPDKQFSQQTSGQPTLFNADAIAPGKPLIWVEGEIDVLAMHEAGFPHVVSLRDGAPERPGLGAKRYDALETHAPELSKVQYHILAGDMDEPGMAQREDLARRLGKHKVRLVTWPDGCKDASDVLRAIANRSVTDFGWDADTLRVSAKEPNDYDASGIHRAIAAAVPYPVEGVLDIEPGSFDRMYEKQPPPVMTTGTYATNAVLRLPTEGKLIVVTGVPSHGKSSWLRFIAVHTIQAHDRRWLVFTAEEDPEDFQTDCAQVIAQKSFRRDMTQEERRQAEDVLRDGTTDFLIDPWNEIEHARGDLSETDYTGRALQRLKAFAREYGCNVWIIAHPAKPPPLRPGENRRPPTGYDISGSAHFTNKSDLGITVWMPATGQADIRVWKSRRHRWAITSATARLEFDQTTGRYRDPIVVPSAQVVDDD